MAVTTPFRYVFDPDVSDEPMFGCLLAYWHGKRAGRDAPLRSDIDPLELKCHLSSLVLVECLPGLDDFRYRLVGTHVAATVGRDSTGKTTRELYAATDPDYCEAMLGLFREIATKKSVARSWSTLRPMQREYRQVDVLLMPLAGRDGSVIQILNGLVFR